MDLFVSIFLYAGGYVMAFVKFTEVGKNFSPRVVMHPTGVVHFNQGARKKFCMDDFSHCVMYLDAESHTVGFEMVNDENIDGANRLRRVQREGVDLNARSFFDHFHLRFKRPISFALRRSLDGELLVMNLEDGEVMWNADDKDRERVSGRDDDRVMRPSSSRVDHDDDDIDDDDDDKPRVIVKPIVIKNPPRDDARKAVPEVVPMAANAAVAANKGRGVKAMLSELLQD